ncbi:hypothetical protein [Quatrionicoccus australiensis]|uniref:hypothetical protein n=1 Tax=Quatrionicoccus australiensis TaxID=138118 RepID=UPI001CFA66B5|nr:hypothetical protein [Quatrionicoccus australiensis]MCB4359593.1 hypothetical protein [Quatrionicoccus australiensis]
MLTITSQLPVPLRDFERVAAPSLDRYPLGLVVASEDDVALIRTVDDVVRPHVSPRLLYAGDVACYLDHADGYVTGNLAPAVLDAQILADIEHAGKCSGIGSFGADYLAGARVRLPYLVHHGVAEARRSGFYNLHKRWAERYKSLMTCNAPEPETPVICGTLVELAVYGKCGRRGILLFTTVGPRFVPTLASRFTLGQRYVAVNPEGKGWQWHKALIAPLRPLISAQPVAML